MGQKFNSFLQFSTVLFIVQWLCYTDNAEGQGRVSCEDVAPDGKSQNGYALVLPMTFPQQRNDEKLLMGISL